MEFLARYYELLRLRFDGGIDLHLPADRMRADHYLIPPISLQLLLENAVKHNEFTAARPLHVALSFEDGAIFIENDKRIRAQVRHTARIGLANLDERCQLLLGRGIEVIDEESRFAVRLPLRPVA